MTEPTDEYEPSAVPCRIHLRNKLTFVVDRVDSWGYVPAGIFAQGHFKDVTPCEDIDILIPHGAVDYITLDYPALKEHLNALAKESTST